MFTFAGGPIKWKSQKQTVGTLSTCDTEYVVACTATQQCIPLRDLLMELVCGINEKVRLYVDNQSAVGVVDNPRFRSNSRYVEIKYHFVKEQRGDGVVDPRYVPSERQLADMLTKALPGPSFERFREMMNLK